MHSDKEWRGFCVPFDVSCHAQSSKEAMKILKNLTELYIEGLEKYNYPKHLIKQNISEPEDRKVFKLLWPKIHKEISIGINKYQKLQKFLEEDNREIEVRERNSFASVSQQLVPQL